MDTSLHSKGLYPNMNTAPTFKRVDWLLIAASVVAAPTCFALTNTDIDVDDAYISYRYVENLAKTGQAVYNLGDRVYGSTAMLWVFVLALVCRTTGASAEHSANILAAALTGANAALTYALIRFNRGSVALATTATAALLSFPLFMLVSSLGMETAFLTFLILVSLHAFTRGWMFRAGVISGLIFATRPDGLAVVLSMLATTLVGLLPIYGGRLLGRRRQPVPEVAKQHLAEARRILGGFSVVALPFVSFCQSYYGSILPNTLSAKRAIPLVVAGRWWMPEHFVTGPGLPVTLALALGAALLVRHRNSDGILRERRTQLFLLTGSWLLLYAFAWTMTGIDKYIWYVAAMAAPSVVALAVPALLVGEDGGQPELRTWPWIARLLLFAAMLSVVGWWGRDAQQTIKHWNSVYIEAQEHRRKALGVAVSKYAVPTQEVLTTGAIGIVGYTCGGCYVVDALGLVTPLAKLNSYPRPTIWYNADSAGPTPEFKYVYWSTEPRIGGEGSVLLTNRTLPSTWDPERIRPSIFVNASFGKDVTLIGANPVRKSAAPGDVIQFEALWKFARPLSSDSPSAERIESGTKVKTPAVRRRTSFGRTGAYESRNQPPPENDVIAR